MGTTKLIFGWSHVVLAVAVGLQFVASAIYDDDAVSDVWVVLNWLMAIGVISALVFSYLQWRSALKSDQLELISANVMMIASVVLFLTYFEQWFNWTVFKDASDEAASFRLLLWVLIDVLFVVVNGAVGIRLLRRD